MINERFAGVIAEYNPFHNGHAFHLREAKRLSGASRAVVIMSGSFTQRGEPAVYDKYSRARAALLCGADLVLELPLYAAVSSAEYFARGGAAALRALNSVGLCDYIAFGAETDDLAELKTLADLREAPEFNEKLRALLAEGHSYTRAVTLSCESFGQNALFGKPNNILAVEYLRAIRNSPIIPINIRRTTVFHDPRATGSVASATAVREAVFAGDFAGVERTVPREAFKLYENAGSARIDRLSPILQYILKTGGYAVSGEGLERRIADCASRNFQITSIIAEVKTKRYTFTKINRTILKIILGIDDSYFRDFRGECQNLPYLRVLGARRDALRALSALAETGAPVVASAKKGARSLSGAAKRLFDKEIEAGDIYAIAQGKAGAARGEYGRGIILV
ncbi:MAG: nucleotidyltransferase family protein [Clostridiales bacterium]|nr:nucleotidyltransferase family protein [Clostridiales bacterium]